MKLKLVATLMFGAFALSAGTALAGPADDAIKAREACMKANGAAMGVFVPITKGEKPFDQAVVAEAVGKVEAACAGFANWWGEDTKQGETLKTRAKPEMWSDPEGFQAAGAAYGSGLAAIKTATDETTFKDGFAKFGASCGGCHQKFRAPEG